MKIIKPINQHFPIWSFICGDHALKNDLLKINPKLLKEPDLLDPLENNLRLEVFCSKRNWIKKDMGNDCSFALAQLSISDLDKFKSCFSQVMFKELPKEYKSSLEARRDFLIKRKEGYEDIKKSYASVKNEHELVKKIEKNYKPIKESMILDTRYNNQDNISIALNRTFIMEDNQGNIIVMDGLHRLSAYYWSKKLNANKKLPDKLYCYYWRSNYKC